MKNRFKLLTAVALIAILPACASTDAQKAEAFFGNPVTQNVIKAVEPVAINAVSQYVANGGKWSSAQAVNLGLQSIVNLAPTVTSNADLQNLIVNTATQFAGDPGFKKPAQDIAAAVIKSLPVAATPKQIATAVSAAGVAVSNAANP
jgi:hypothetical protein